MTAPIKNRFEASTTDNSGFSVQSGFARKLTLAGSDSNTVAMRKLVRVLNEVVAEGVLPTL